MRDPLSNPLASAQVVPLSPRQMAIRELLKPLRDLVRSDCYELLDELARREGLLP